MHTIIKTPLTLKLLGAFAALALLAVAALAVALTINPAAAQSPDNAYADPQPCGPGAQTAYQPEPHEITEGHFALFDAYWEWRVQDPNDENVGLLHTNLCPPLVTQTVVNGRGGPQTVTSLVDSSIDINEAIFHVLDTHKVTVVDGDQYDPAANQLPAEQYLELVADEHIGAGTQVWWLRLDDPNTADVDETSDLVLGFSTKRFDDQYWGGANDGGPPFRYKFEVERNPGIDPENHPHLFVYRALDPGADRAKLLWSTAAPDVVDLTMEAGELEDLQWIFTQPGTYEIWVHLQGWARHYPPAGADEDWRPISEYETETSVYQRYVIHVGDHLELNESPLFLLERSANELLGAGEAVGDAIAVREPDDDSLAYTLYGEGHELFCLDTVSSGQPGVQQIQLQLAGLGNAGGECSDSGYGGLDYEVQPEYNLVLSVTDGKDRASNDDTYPTADSAVALRVRVGDGEETRPATPPAQLLASRTQVPLGESVELWASISDLPASAHNLRISWTEGQPPTTDFQPTGSDYRRYVVREAADTVSGSVSETYYFRFGYDFTNGSGLIVSRWITSSGLTITWSGDNGG